MAEEVKNTEVKEKAPRKPRTTKKVEAPAAVEVKAAPVKLRVVCPEKNDLFQSPSAISFSGAPSKYI